MQITDKNWISKHRIRLNHEFTLNGFVSIPGFLTTDELARLQENKKRFICDVVPKMPMEQVYYEDKDAAAASADTFRKCSDADSAKESRTVGGVHLGPDMK